MYVYYITFRSVTFAQRGEKLLNRNGIRADIRRTPRWMEQQGCGYALKLRTDDISRAVRDLKNHQIPLRRIYVRLEDGRMEEVDL